MRLVYQRRRKAVYRAFLHYAASILLQRKVAKKLSGFHYPSMRKPARASMPSMIQSIIMNSTCRHFSQSPRSPPDCEGGGRAA
jgi:tetrahydromethanopterin S-methyltransferase subunit D